ncbi:MAG: hypothetical protein AVDCRST_MAG67-488, partial [uncultured Solirubrobacteraceae bacterium]
AVHDAAQDLVGAADQGRGASCPDLPAANALGKGRTRL